jgi:GLPGLI family protein
MKNILLISALALSTVCGYAQKKIFEGKITYQVEWQPTPEMQQLASMFPSELTVYFKGDSSATLSKSNFSNSSTIVNAKTEYQRLLLDIPMNGKKYSIIFTPDDLGMMKEYGPDFSLTPASETKTIGEYSAKKYTITEKKSGKSSDAWFTSELSIIPNSLTQFFDKSAGFPLEFASFQSGVGLKASVKEVKEGPVPAATFIGSKDYEEITFAQLMSMIGR